MLKKKGGEDEDVDIYMTLVMVMEIEPRIKEKPFILSTITISHGQLKTLEFLLFFQHLF